MLTKNANHKSSNGNKLKSTIQSKPLTEGEKVQAETIAAIDRYLALKGTTPYHSTMRNFVEFIIGDGYTSNADDLEYFFIKIKDFLFDPQNASLFYSQTNTKPKHVLTTLNSLINFFQGLSIDERVDADITRYLFEHRFAFIQRKYENDEFDLDMEVKFYNKEAEKIEVRNEVETRYTS